MSWVVVLAVIFMMIFTMLGAKLGVVATHSNGTLIAQRAGRWLAAVIGLGVFFISAAFQFGNNLGVRSAFAEYQQVLDRIPGLQPDVIVVLLNLLAGRDEGTQAEGARIHEKFGHFINFGITIM